MWIMCILHIMWIMCILHICESCVYYIYVNHVFITYMWIMCILIICESCVYYIYVNHVFITYMWIMFNVCVDCKFSQHIICGYKMFNSDGWIAVKTRHILLPVPSQYVDIRDHMWSIWMKCCPLLFKLPFRNWSIYVHHMLLLYDKFVPKKMIQIF